MNPLEGLGAKRMLSIYEQLEDGNTLVDPRVASWNEDDREIRPAQGFVIVDLYVYPDEKGKAA